MKKLSKIQRAHFKHLKTVNCNNLNGARIVKDLIDKTELWERVIPFFNNGSILQELKQKELLEDFINIDTLYILPPVLDSGVIDTTIKTALYKLAHSWRADEIAYCKIAEITYLKVWFD